MPDLMVTMLEAGMTFKFIRGKKLACRGFPWASITRTRATASFSTSI